MSFSTARALTGYLLVRGGVHQIAYARRRVVDHLVDLELVVASAGLEEEVVGEVLDEVA